METEIYKCLGIEGLGIDNSKCLYPTMHYSNWDI